MLVIKNNSDLKQLIIEQYLIRYLLFEKKKYFYFCSHFSFHIINKNITTIVKAKKINDTLKIKISYIYRLAEYFDYT